MMKKIAVVVAVVVTMAFAITGSGLAQRSGPRYQQVAKFTPGGDGFWDLLTFDAATQRLFIAHADVITVIDGSTGKVVGTVPAQGAHGIAVISDKHLAFSTNGRSGTVTVFDTQTLKPQQEIKAGDNPDAILYDEHSKKVIVGNGRSKDLTIIDPASFKMIATVPLNAKPELAAADAAHVYVNLEDTGEIAQIDPKTWKVAQRWKLQDCEEPTGLALDESAHRLFAACSGSKKMAVVDAKNGKTIAMVATGGGTDGAAFDPKLKLAFAPNGEGTLTVIRETSDSKYEGENVTTQRGARTIALDPKSHRVFLPTAEFGPPAEGQRRPTIKPGSFTVLVYGPAK
jgi:YVTN family beta-propeller protein